MFLNTHMAEISVWIMTYTVQLSWLHSMTPFWETSSLHLSVLHAGTHLYTFLGSHMFIIQQDYGTSHIHREHTYTPYTHTHRRSHVYNTQCTHIYAHTDTCIRPHARNHCCLLIIHHNAWNERLMNSHPQLPKHAQTH